MLNWDFIFIWFWDNKVAGEVIYYKNTDSLFYKLWGLYPKYPNNNAYDNNPLFWLWLIDNNLIIYLLADWNEHYYNIQTDTVSPLLEHYTGVFDITKLYNIDMNTDNKAFQQVHSSNFSFLENSNVFNMSFSLDFEVLVM